MTKELKFLLHNESPVDSPDKYGFTPLHRAANQGSIDAVKFLLKNEADMNATNIYGATAFHYAAMGLKIEVMKYLVKHGANVQAIDNCGWNAYDYAESFNRFHKEIFGFLLDLKLRETKFEDGQKNYIYGNTKYFNPKHLLACRQSIDVRGWTPLHYASRFSDQDIIEFLLQKGFRCDAQTISSYNCLHLAACNKNIGVIKLIWDNFGNGDKNAKDFKGFAPIHLASAKGHISIVKYLLDQSDIEKQPLNQDQSNPLHEAVMFKQKEVVELLLKNGLDKNLKNKKGETPKMLAKHIVTQSNGWEINDLEILHILSPRIKRKFKIEALKAASWLFGPSQNARTGSGTTSNNFVAVNHTINSTTGDLSQARDALVKRGENLSRLENLTENIESQAQIFAKNALELRRKNEKLYA
jgi:ankyrin repeat protein